MSDGPILEQVNLVVSDMEVTVDFYRRLGLTIDELPHEWNATREEVDEIYARLTDAGAKAQQSPIDAFWGSRYAVVEDPDGNAVGIMSPPETEHRGPGPSF